MPSCFLPLDFEKNKPNKVAYFLSMKMTTFGNFTKTGTIKDTRYLCFSGKKKYAQLPPGPPNLPLVGSLPFLGKDIQEPLRQMAQK